VVFHQYQKCLQNQPGLSGEEMMHQKHHYRGSNRH
jgi:hypothetical protein